jgi:hypothetical protein
MPFERRLVRQQLVECAVQLGDAVSRPQGHLPRDSAR